MCDEPEISPTVLTTRANPSSGDREWKPSLGAWPEADGFRFRLWAPERQSVAVVLDPEGAGARAVPLAPQGDGTFAVSIPGVSAGTRYKYTLDGEGPYPDPASRSQPGGVHGPSATVDPHRFRWSDDGWRGMPLHRAAFYELHVGTFSAAGTFAGAMEHLAALRDLGITVVELMPVADFPGARNWGYDGVSLFAPARVYGAPDDLRALVDAAHALGMAVVLDVVYNHFGPDGAYAFACSPYYASSTHESPWGKAVNFDGAHSEHVRAFVIENALHWLHEYHLDGLRLDATHAMADTSPKHVMAELAARARATLPGRDLLLVAEDDRNLASIVRPQREGGWGFDAVWADDFHHHARRLTAGDADGYFEDFSGDVADLAATLTRGWFYVGQHSAYHGAPRGTDPGGIPPKRMVICIQNHDQVGNRAFGDRLHHRIDAAVYRALTTVLLCAPETPLLFMGQEWAASTPFLYFTDHEPALGRLVTAGRRQEFSRFAVFADEGARSRIPDPQAESTFDASRLLWAERDLPGHAGVLALYRALLALRGTHPALTGSHGASAFALDADTLAIMRPGTPETASLFIVARLRGQGAVTGSAWPESVASGRWSALLTSDDALFVGDSGGTASSRPHVSGDALPTIVFSGPSAVILERR